MAPKKSAAGKQVEQPLGDKRKRTTKVNRSNQNVGESSQQVDHGNIVSIFLQGCELPTKWKNYVNLSVLPERNFCVKDIIEKFEDGEHQLRDTVRFFNRKQLGLYAKPKYVVYPTLVKLFYSTLTYKEPNICVTIAGKEYSFSEDDVVSLFNHSPEFIDASTRCPRPTNAVDKYPSLSLMVNELFMLDGTNKRHHLKLHTHIILDILIKSNIIPLKGSKDVCSKEVITIMYGIVNYTILPAQTIFHRLKIMCSQPPVILPYPSTIIALLCSKGYKIPDGADIESIESKTYKASDWSRGLTNSYSERVKAFYRKGLVITKGLVIDGEPVPVQPPNPTLGPSYNSIIEAINRVHTLLINQGTEIRARFDSMDSKLNAYNARFDNLEAEVRAIQEARNEDLVDDDDEPIIDDEMEMEYQHAREEDE